MIHVIASIYVKEGKMSDVQKVYESFVPKVNSEKGCIMYLPTIDHKTDLPTQVLDDKLITVIEKWESKQSFQTHLSASHVIEFRKQIVDIVEKVSIKVLEEIQ